MSDKIYPVNVSLVKDTFFDYKSSVLTFMVHAKTKFEAEAKGRAFATIYKKQEGKSDFIIKHIHVGSNAIWEPKEDGSDILIVGEAIFKNKND